MKDVNVLCGDMIDFLTHTKAPLEVIDCYSKWDPNIHRLMENSLPPTLKS